MFIFFTHISGGCLQANPEHRLSISGILERIAAIAESNGYNLKAPLILSQDSDSESSNVNNTCTNDVKVPPPTRPAPPSMEPVRPAPAVKFVLFIYIHDTYVILIICEVRFFC